MYSKFIKLIRKILFTLHLCQKKKKKSFDFTETFIWPLESPTSGTMWLTFYPNPLPYTRHCHYIKMRPQLFIGTEQFLGCDWLID